MPLELISFCFFNLLTESQRSKLLTDDPPINVLTQIEYAR
jgi:hypothetical protein